MINAEDILNVISTELENTFPERTIYIDKIPKEFKDPSFLIELVKANMMDKSISTIEVTYHFTLTCYDDFVNNNDKFKRIRIQNAILKLFSSGKLKVHDRMISIQTSSLKKEDVFYVNLKVMFMDSKELLEEKYDLMQEINTKFKEG